MPINEVKLRQENTRRAFQAKPSGVTVTAYAAQVWAVLGWKSPDACRHWLERVAREPDMVIDFEVAPPAPPDPPTIIEMTKRIKGVEKKLQKAEALTEIFSEIVWEVVTPFQPVRIPIIKPPKKGNRREEFALSLISDMHVGAFHELEETAGLSQFSLEILFEEVRTWKMGLRDCLSIQRSAVPVKRGLFCIGGDIPTGEDIYPKQWAEIDQLLMEQVTYGGFILADMLSFGAELFETVDVLAVEGNHKRTMTTTISTDHLSYILAAMLLRNNPRINFQYTRSPFVAWSEPSVERNGEPWNYLLSHGSDIQGWNRIPYYGLDRARAEWIDLTGMVYDSVLVGHHHRYAETQGWIMNGSWVGGSSFSIGKLRAANQATQGLLFHNPKIGFTSRWPLYLSPKPRYERVKVTGMTVHSPVQNIDQLIRETLPDSLKVDATGKS